QRTCPSASKRPATSKRPAPTPRPPRSSGCTSRDGQGDPRRELLSSNGSSPGALDARIIERPFLQRRRSFPPLRVAAVVKPLEPILRPAGVQAAPLSAASKLFASNAGMLWIFPRPWLAYQTENASIASAFGASTTSTKS